MVSVWASRLCARRGGWIARARAGRLGGRLGNGSVKEEAGLRGLPPSRLLATRAEGCAKALGIAFVRHLFGWWCVFLAFFNGLVFGPVRVTPQAQPEE